MEDSTWRKVINQKKQKRKTKHREIEEEKNKWERLRNEIPHIILPNRAKRLQMKLNIDKLELKLLSDPFIEYQRQGWKYVKVLKSSNKSISNEIPFDTITPLGDYVIYSILSLDNGWGDTVLFGMTKSETPVENSNSSE